MPKPSQVRSALIAAAIGILFGVPVGCAGYTAPAGSFSVVGIATAAIVFCTYAVSFEHKLLVAVALVMGLFLGYARGAAMMHVPSEYAAYYDGHSELLADIVSEPQQKDGYIEANVRAVSMDQEIIVRMPTGADPQFGQEVVLSGTIHAPQLIGAFDYPGYLRSKGITATEAMPHAFAVGEMKPTPMFLMQEFGYWLQSNLSERILDTYAVAQQPFVKALMFGDRGDFVQGQSEPFVRTGTIHLVAVSGFKLTILLLMLQYILQPFVPRKWLIALTVAVSGLYASAFGFDPPVLRAAVMSSLFIVTELVGGGYESAPLLVVLAGTVAFMNPAAELFDSSMLFSMLGVLGIIVVGPVVHKAFRRVPYASFPLKFLAPAAGAYLLTVPLSLHWYGEASTLMPLTALCIMPLFEPSVVLGYLSAVPAFGKFAAATNQPLLAYMSWMVTHLSAFRFAVIPIQVSGCATYATYAVAVMGYWYLALKKAHGSATIPALPTQPAP